MIFKIVLLSLLAFMVYNLFRALIIMNKNDPKQPPMSQFIGRRVMVSIAIVILLLLGILTGWITPNTHP
jgi:NADH:ubiquinone oxidoreductase subunit 2 (subunit N)